MQRPFANLNDSELMAISCLVFREAVDRLAELTGKEVSEAEGTKSSSFRMLLNELMARGLLEPVQT